VFLGLVGIRIKGLSGVLPCKAQTFQSGGQSMSKGRGHPRVVEAAEVFRDLFDIGLRGGPIIFN